MQKRAGLLYLAKSTGRILLILENSKWTVPTFDRKGSLLEDSTELCNSFSKGKIVPIELYHSKDNGFEYGTYVCLTEEEFLVNISTKTYAWCILEDLPKNIHAGLKTTLNTQITRTKINTILELSKI